MHKATTSAVSWLDYAMTLSIPAFNIVIVRSKSKKCGHSESLGCHIKILRWSMLSYASEHFRSQDNISQVDPTIL
jgi:hypothetical protein